MPNNLIKLLSFSFHATGTNQYFVYFLYSGWNFVFKKLYAEYILNKNKKRQLKFIKELRKYESEAPKLLPNEESTDSQKIYGTDQDGNSLLIKFTRRKHGTAEVWLILRLKCEQQKYVTYTLPGMLKFAPNYHI